jgi:hypothetical protein
MMPMICYEDAYAHVMQVERCPHNTGVLHELCGDIVAKFCDMGCNLRFVNEG